MSRHPGGQENTRRLLELAALPKGSRVLDLGAGAGETVRLLRELGYDAEGVDLEPRGEGVMLGDMLRTTFDDGQFDGVISQCAFYLTGDVGAAFRESARLLRCGGLLMLADVRPESWDGCAVENGLFRLGGEDMTGQWREYYLGALWRGEAEPFPGGANCAYALAVYRKE